MRDERGFTLIETVVVTMLIGVVLGAVSGAFVLLLDTTNATTQRLSESPDLQIAAAYFGSDVQSAASFSSSCGGPLAAGQAQLLGVSWTDPGASAATGDDSARSVSYVVAPVGNQKHLLRYECVGAAAAQRTTLMTFVSPASTPAVSCTPAPCGPTTATVEAPLTICTANETGTCQDDPLTFTLRAGRRAVA